MRIALIALSFVTGILIAISSFYFSVKTGFAEGLSGYSLKAFVVQSGSMEPAIKAGSVAVTLKVPEYSRGDIITFSAMGDNKNLVTHRIYTKEGNEYITKGDANEEADQLNVKDKQIVGKVVFSIPYIGYLVDFGKKPYGFILVVIIPATILVYEELKRIKDELGKLLARFQIPLSFGGLKGLSKVFLFVPVIGAGVIFISFSGAFFSDIETSVGNSLTAATPTPSPTIGPGHIVINELMWMGSTKGTADEWVELRNTTSNTIDISNWQVTKWVTSGRGDHEELMLTIPSGNSIAAGGLFLIAAKSPGVGTALLVAPDIIDSSVVLSNTALQVRLFVSNWDSGGLLIDTAGNKGVPLAGSHSTGNPKKFFSMERNSVPGDGTQAANWHTASTSVNFDPDPNVNGIDQNKGTPKTTND